LLAALLATPAASAAEVLVEITQVGEAKGNILAAAYDKADHWLKRTPHLASAPAKAGSVTLTFPNLPEGDYAFSVVHDLNGNNRLDMNAVGMPIEPFAFSNDAVGHFGPPTFDAAKVRVTAGAKLVIKLN
jgi:uncharacterized protein (DUF2141 family)